MVNCSFASGYSTPYPLPPHGDIELRQVSKTFWHNFEYVLKKTVAILLFVLLVCGFANGQQGNNVAFGRFGGLNFNTSPPSVFASKSTYTNYPSTCVVTISDCEGNILFYTNGDSVWHKNHEVMENGCLIPPGKTSNMYTFPVLAIPYPDSLYKYIVIYGTDYGTHYAVIDMSQNGGFGRVTTKQKLITNTVIHRNTDIIRHSNGKDFWFITKENDTQFYAYPITKNGFGNNVTSKGIGERYFSTIKANNNGTMIAVSVNAHNPGLWPYNNPPAQSAAYPVYVYDFNNSTGVFSSPKPALNWSQIPNSEALALQFSPNDSLLYITSRASGYFGFTNRKKLFQVRVKGTMFFPVYYQNTLIDKPVYGDVMGLLLGPDNKIYMSEGYDTNKIAIIHNPDVFGAGCNIQRGAIDIGNARTGSYMGTVYQPVYDVKFASNARDSICTDTASFALQGDTSPFKEYILYFGDGDSSILYNTNRNATHKYNAEGKYLVRLKAITKECNFPIWRTDSVNVRFNPKAKFVIDSTLISCGKRTFFIRDSSLRTDSFLFNWHTLKPSIIGTNKGDFSIVIDSSATYLLVHSVKNDWGCTDTFRQNLNITIGSFPTKGFSIDEKDSAGCLPHTVTLHDSAKYSTQTIFYWNDGDSLITTSPGNVVAHYQRTYTKAGIFKPWQVVSNTDGCKDTFYFPKTITVSKKAKAGFSFVLDSTCNDVTIILNDTSQFADSITYTSPYFLTGEAGISNSHLYLQDGIYLYKQRAWNKYCTDSFSISIPLYKKQKPDVGLSIDKMAGCSPLEIIFNDDSTKSQVKSWSVNFGDGNTTTGSTGLQNQKHTYFVAVTYEGILTDTASNGCINSDTVAITVYPNPVAQYSVADTNLCGKLTVTISDNSLLADSITIDWSNKIVGNISNSANVHQYPFRSVDTIRTIYYTAKTNNGCFDTDTLTIAQIHHNLPLTPNMLGVSVTDKQEITLEWEKAAGVGQYLIERSINGVNYSPLSQFSPSAAAVQTFKQTNQPTDNVSVYYRVKATDSCAVESQSSRFAKTMVLKAVVDVNEIAILEWTPYEDWQNGVKEYKVEYWDKISIQPNPVYTLLNLLSGFDETYTDTGFAGSLGDERCYRITAIENNGNNYQSYSNEVCLPLKPVIIIPNAFSPNGDGLNDVFSPSLYAMKEVSMQIFNRYGQLIYTETSQQPHWDGTFEGMPVPSDAYLVMIAARANNLKKINYSGMITVIR